MKGLNSAFLTFLIGAWAYTGVLSIRFMYYDKWDKIMTPIGAEIIKDVTDLDSLVSLHTDLNKGDVSFESQGL